MRNESDFLELEPYQVEIYQDLVRNRQYYQLASVVLESEIGDLGFNQSLTEMNWILFKVITSTSTTSVRHRQYHQLISDILESKIGELGGGRYIGFSLELERYQVGIYQDIVRHQHYYMLPSDIIEYEIGELIFIKL